MFIITLLFLGILVFSNSKVDLEKQIYAQLNSTSDILESSINTFLQSQKDKIELIATQSELSSEELSNMLRLDNSFYELFVINSGGKIISSSDEQNIGLDVSEDPYFVNARNETYVKPFYYSKHTKVYSFTISTPFHGNVFVGRVDGDSLSKIVSDKTGLGKTEESLLAFLDANGSVVYFSERLFSDKKIEILSREQALSRPIYKALFGEEILTKGLRDYRGVRVLSATNFVEGINIGMVTKIDESEAFASIYSLQKTIFILVGISIILIIFLIYIVTRPITQEINEITKDIEEITKGDLDITLEKSSLFEIDSLVNSLNRILASMKLAILRTGVGKSEIGLGEAIEAKNVAEDKYKILYETSSEAIMTLEPPKWNFSAGNPAAIRMFGAKDEKDFISRAPGEFSPRKQIDGSLSSMKAKENIEKALRDGKNQFSWMHKRLNGVEFPANVLLTRVKEGDKEYLQATVRDLSLNSKEEEEMKKQNPKLYSKLLRLKQEADNLKKKKK